MNLLVISSRFPNRIQKQFGIYVYELLKELSHYNNIQVLCPVSLTPPIDLLKETIQTPYSIINYYKTLNQIPKFDNYKGIPVRYIKHFYLPKKIAQFTEGFILYAKLLPIVYNMRSHFKFDIIHGHFAFPEGLAAYLLGKTFGVPSVIHCHGSEITTDLGKNYIQTKLTVYALTHADFKFAVSNDIRNKILEYTDLNGSLKVVTNGVNINKFYPKGKNSARKHLGLPLNQRIILFVGNLFNVKGVNYLIDAMEEIKLQEQEIRLYIIGDGILKEALIRKVRKLNLENIIFFSGSISHNKVPIWMSAADLFILPSLSEGWPSVLPESFACGTPVVASRIGGIPEMINSDNYGYLTNPRDSHDIAQKIIKALNKSWDRDALIQRAKECSWEKIAKNIQNVYENLIF